MKEILQAILNERARQDAKWGAKQHDPTTWLAILMKEVGEASRGALEGDSVGYADELVQVAAVAVAALENHHSDLPKCVDDSVAGRR